MKIARKRFASILLVIGLTGISPAWSQTPERHHTFRKAKVVWRSCESNTVKLGDLARWASPILWFSPDEPLLEHRKSDDPLIKKEYLTQSEKVVPNVMPYDEVPGGPEQRAVYAWIRKLRPRPEAKRGDLLKKYAKSPLQRRL